MPRASICCSVLNQSDLLTWMIDSVRKQTFTDWELIIIDDGSTENIQSVVASFNDPRITLERFPENKGIPWGINRAFEMASGDYVQALAADETIIPTKLEDQVAYLDANRSIEAIWGLPNHTPQGMMQNPPLGERPEWEQYHLGAHNRSNEAWVKTLLELDNVPLGSASCLFRRGLLTSVGYFDTTLTAFSDHEWFTRFFHQGHSGRVLPYRWSTCQPIPSSVSVGITKAEVERQLAYVRAKNPLRLPAVQRTVTVAIPCFNMSHWIGDTLKSLFAQTVQPMEILIVDDCSTDNLSEVLETFNDPRIRYFKMEENQGNIAANNFMLLQAKGAFIVVSSADDTVEPDFIEKALKEFEANPWLEFVSSLTDFVDASGTFITDEMKAANPIYTALMNIKPAFNAPRRDLLNALYQGNHYFGIGMYRTQAVKDVGGWKKSCEVIADYEMYLALLQRGEIKVIEEKLTHTRIHDKNLSNLSVNKPKTPLGQLYNIARKPYYPPKMKVIIATPFYEMKAFSPYVSSLAGTIKLLTMLGIEHEFWELSGDSYVHRARNTICTKFLEDYNATDLFFIDSDMSWNADAFIRMLLLPEGVVGAAYPTKNMWQSWTSSPEVKIEDGRAHPVGRILQDGSALIVADTLATGFMRIKRSVLEEFRDKNPDMRYFEPCADQSAPERQYIEFFSCGKHEDGLWYGEDRMFCKRLKEMGTSLHIYPNVTIHHYGVKGWEGNYDKFLRGVKDYNDQQPVKANDDNGARGSSPVV